MSKTPRRTLSAPRGTRTSQKRKAASPAPRSRAVGVETLREQADRLGLLDPLDAEPSNVFSPVAARDSDA